MKRIFKIILLLISFHAGVVVADNIDTDIPPEYKERYALVEKLDKSENDKAYEEYIFLREKLPNSFSVAYGFGRLLARMKRYQKSDELLKEALNLGTNNRKILNLSIYNTLGWVSIMNANYDQALEYFDEALKENVYKNVSVNTRMKTHNNKGYTLMLLDRYEESLVEFRKASGLGSEKAKYNIERVNSMIETQKKQDQDIIGVFAPVIFSLKNKESIAPVIEFLSKQYGIVQDKLKIYVSKTKIYIITYGSNYSYVEALRIKEDMEKKGISDAYVYSTTSWEPYKIDIDSISGNH